MPADWMEMVYAEWVASVGPVEAERIAAAWGMTPRLSIANTELDGQGWE